MNGRSRNELSWATTTLYFIGHFSVYLRWHLLANDLVSARERSCLLFYILHVLIFDANAIHLVRVHTPS